MFLSRYYRKPLSPRFYYGWAMAPMAMLGVMCTAPAQTYGISVFIPFIRNDLGLSPAQTSAAYMLGTFLASLPLTWIGACMDRYGLRRTMTVVILGFCLACVALSQVVGLLTLFGAFFILRLFGQGALTMLSENTMAFWFHRRLGIVNGMKSAGVALVIAGAPAFHLLLIQEAGWRQAYLFLAAWIALLLLPLMFFFYRNRPEDVGQVMDGGLPAKATTLLPDTRHDWPFREAVRTRAYWIVAACISLWAFIGTAVAFCATSILEARGIQPTDAAQLVSQMFVAMGLTLMVAHLIAGGLADRIPLNRLLSLTMCLMCGVGFFLGRAGSENHIWTVGLMMGASQACMGAVSATVWVRYFGREALGRIRGSIVTLLVAASSAGPFLVDGLANLAGTYASVITLLAWLPLPFALAALFAVKPHRP